MPEEFNAIWEGDNTWSMMCEYHVMWMCDTVYTDSLGDMDAVAMWFGMSV